LPAHIARPAGWRKRRTAEQQADKTTPDVPAYHWMLGMRLTNLGMKELAEKHYARAIQLDSPRFAVYRPP
jgi:hypothetical protein